MPVAPSSLVVALLTAASSSWSSSVGRALARGRGAPRAEVRTRADGRGPAAAARGPARAGSKRRGRARGDRLRGVVAGSSARAVTTEGMPARGLLVKGGGGRAGNNSLVRAFGPIPGEVLARGAADRRLSPRRRVSGVPFRRDPADMSHRPATQQQGRPATHLDQELEIRSPGPPQRETDRHVVHQEQSSARMRHAA